MKVSEAIRGTAAGYSLKSMLNFISKDEIITCPEVNERMGYKQTSSTTLIELFKREGVDINLYRVKAKKSEEDVSRWHYGHPETIAALKKKWGCR